MYPLGFDLTSMCAAGSAATRSGRGVSWEVGLDAQVSEVTTAHAK